MSVAVLFARRDSIYKTFDGLDVYDEERDALTYPGKYPVIAHPPCRAVIARIYSAVAGVLGGVIEFRIIIDDVNMQASSALVSLSAIIIAMVIGTVVGYGIFLFFLLVISKR